MMFELGRRFLNGILVRFWSIGYKKRIVLQILLLLIIVVACLLVRISLFADLTNFQFIEAQTSDRNASSLRWDKWVRDHGYKAIGDIWDGCNPDAPRLKIGKIVLEFNEKTQRVMATVVANGTLHHTVSEGKVNIVAQYHGRTLYDHDENMCKVNAKTFKCPIKKGEYLTVFESFALPKYIPKGRYSAKARIINQDGLCVAIAESEIKL